MNKNKLNDTMIIVIPMAGASSRFYDAGYTVPKYRLPLGCETVFDKSVRSFQNYFNNAFFLFVVRKDDMDVKEFVADHSNLLGIKCFQIVELDTITKGQAETVMLGLKKAGLERGEDTLVIFNIDTIRHNLIIPEGNYSSFFDAFYDERADEKKWSFADVNDNKNLGAMWLKSTTEKKKISNWCSTGLYIFGYIRLFVDAYYEAITHKSYNYYIAPLYNYLIPKDIYSGPSKSSNLLMICPPNDIEFSGVPDEYEELKIKYKNEENF